MPQKVFSAVPINLSGNGETTVLGPFNVNPNWTQAYVQLKRYTTATPQFLANPLTRADVGIYLSIDGGVFRKIGGFGVSGGLRTNEQGEETPVSDYATSGLRDGPRRQVKVAFTVEGPDNFVSEADLTLT